jgi:hypothetical protein
MTDQLAYRRHPHQPRLPDPSGISRSPRKLLKAVEDLHIYVERNREFVPN